MSDICRTEIPVPTVRLRRMWRGALLSCVMAALSFGESETVRPRELTWDDTEKSFFGKPGDAEAKFIFTVGNETGAEITIYRIQPSCGCTTVDVPATPWILVPGATGTVRATVDLKDKYGMIEKTLTVDSSLGQETLRLRLFLPAMTADNNPRTRNQRAALADRQAVFHGDCARCHVPPSAAVSGEAIFKAGCAICHEAPARASMVPNLALPKGGRDEAFWMRWIAEGRPNSLMPAFALKNGGVLSEQQIQDVVNYLVSRFEPSSAVAK